MKLWVTTVQPIAFTKPKKIGVIVSNLMMSLLLTRRDVFLNIFMHAFYAGLGKNSFLKKVIKSETTEVLKLKKNNSRGRGRGRRNPPLPIVNRVKKKLF